MKKQREFKLDFKKSQRLKFQSQVAVSGFFIGLLLELGFCSAIGISVSDSGWPFYIIPVGTSIFGWLVTWE